MVPVLVALPPWEGMPRATSIMRPDRHRVNAMQPKRPCLSHKGGPILVGLLRGQRSRVYALLETLPCLDEVHPRLCRLMWYSPF